MAKGDNGGGTPLGGNTGAIVPQQGGMNGGMGGNIMESLMPLLQAMQMQRGNQMQGGGLTPGPSPIGMQRGNSMNTPAAMNRNNPTGNQGFFRGGQAPSQGGGFSMNPPPMSGAPSAGKQARYDAILAGRNGGGSMGNNPPMEQSTTPLPTMTPQANLQQNPSMLESLMGGGTPSGTREIGGSGYRRLNPFPGAGAKLHYQ